MNKVNMEISRLEIVIGTIGFAIILALVSISMALRSIAISLSQ